MLDTRREEPTPPVYGSSIFCDDIRIEINAKHSFIGVYPHALSISGNFPAVLPKLCIATYLYEINDLACSRDWEIPIFVLGPGQSIDNPILRGNIPPPPENIKVSPDIKIEEMPQLYMISAMTIVFQPLIINTAGFLRVRAQYKDKIIKLGSLRIEHVPTIPTP